MQLREFFGEKKNGETSAMKINYVGDGGNWKKSQVIS